MISKTSKTKNIWFVINTASIMLFLIILFILRQSAVIDYLKYNTEGQNIALRLQDFFTLFLSILVEAMPFVVLGVLVSVFVALFVRETFLLKILPQNKLLRHMTISLLGIFMPVCECGNIPVARRLIIKGFSVSEAVTFLLAAPILNPITFFSTWEAFKLDRSVVSIRMLGGFIIAVTVGLIISYRKNQQDFLTTNTIDLCKHDHEHKVKYSQSLEIFRTEFIEVMKMLIIGAILAAISQTFIPRDFILKIGQDPTLSIISMLLLGFVISICSNVDAFFALSYVNSFTKGGIITFLIFGPMIDIKILTMMKTTFKANLLIYVSVLVTLMSIIAGLIVNLVI